MPDQELTKAEWKRRYVERFAKEGRRWGERAFEALGDTMDLADNPEECAESEIEFMVEE